MFAGHEVGHRPKVGVREDQPDPALDRRSFRCLLRECLPLGEAAGHVVAIEQAGEIRVQSEDLFRACQNAWVRRTRMLRGLLIATTVAGVSLPHLIAGEVAGSLPGLLVGIAVGLGCLRVGLVTRSSGARALSAFAITAVALAPLIAYLAQEATERESGVEAAHAEPSLVAAIMTQAPLVILAIVAVRLLVAAVRTVVRVMSRRPAEPTRRSQAPLGPTSPGPLLRPPVPLVSSNGQRAPPFVQRPYRLAPLS